MRCGLAGLAWVMLLSNLAFGQESSRPFEHEYSGVTVDLPFGWRPAEAPGPGGFTLVSSKESREDPYIESLSCTITPAGDKNLQTLLDANTQQLRTTLKELHFFDDHDLKIGEDPAHRRSYTGASDKGMVQCAQVIVLHNRTAFVLTLTTLPSEAGPHETMMDQVMGSVRFGSDFKRVIELATGITVEVPRSWARKPGGNGVILMVEPPLTEGGPSDAFMNVHSIPKPDATIEDLRGRAAEMYKAIDPTAEVVRVENVRAGRVEGVFVEAIRVLAGTRKIRGYSLFLPFNQRVYTAEVVCNVETFEQHKELFDRILKTVRLRGDNEKWFDPETGFHIEFPGAWVGKYGEKDVLATFTAPPESSKVPTTQRVMVQTVEMNDRSLDDALAQQMDQRKTRDGAKVVTAPQKQQVAGLEGQRADLDVGDGDARIRVRLIIFNHGDSRFLITVEATGSIFERNSGVFDEVIQSIRFD